MFVSPVRHFAGSAFFGPRRPDAGPRPLFVWNCAINNVQVQLQRNRAMRARAPTATYLPTSTHCAASGHNDLPTYPEAGQPGASTHLPTYLPLNREGATLVTCIPSARND